MSEQLWFGIVLDRLGEPRIALPPSVQISRLRPDEVPDNFVEEALPLIAPAFVERDWSTESITERVLNRHTLRRLLTARDGQMLIGLTTIHSTLETYVARLHWLVVAEAYRRSLVGTALVTAGGQEALSDGFSQLILKTEVYRAEAKALYRNLGFNELPA